MAFHRIMFDGVIYEFPSSMSTEMINAAMKKIFQLQGGVLQQDKKLKEDLTRHEGKRNWMYRDTKGLRTIGIGFNLERKGAKVLLKKLLGLKPKEIQEILDGKRQLTDSQIDILFNEDVHNAREDARSLFPSFDQQPRGIQDVLTNMSFNMGKTTFSEFKNFKKAIENRDYNQANKQMTNSLWFKQVKTRGVELADVVLSFGQAPTAAIDTSQDISQDAIDAELREITQFTGAEETPEEAEARQAELRRRLGIEGQFRPPVEEVKPPEAEEFDEDLFGPETEAGFFQREDGTFFELTSTGEKIEHGS